MVTSLRVGTLTAAQLEFAVQLAIKLAARRAQANPIQTMCYRIELPIRQRNFVDVTSCGSESFPAIRARVRTACGSSTTIIHLRFQNVFVVSGELRALPVRKRSKFCAGKEKKAMIDLQAERISAVEGESTRHFALALQTVLSWRKAMRPAGDKRLAPQRKR